MKNPPDKICIMLDAQTKLPSNYWNTHKAEDNHNIKYIRADVVVEALQKVDELIGDNKDAQTVIRNTLDLIDKE